MAAVLSKYQVSEDKYTKDSKDFASGSYGKCYKGVMKTTKKKICIKDLKKVPKKKDELNTFLQELLIMADIYHPGCLTLVGYTPPPEKFDRKEKKMTYKVGPSVITPFMERGSLSNLIRMYMTSLVNPSAAPKLNYPTLYTICLYGMAKAMAFLHSKNIVHRDFKPDNVLLNTFYEPVIGDFGLSSHGTSEDTNVGGGVGSPLFMAPELHLQDTVTRKVDVYAYGVTLYQMWQKDLQSFIINDGLGQPTCFQEFQQRIVKGARFAYDQTALPPPQVIKMIESCWHSDPAQRPEFTYKTKIEIAEEEKHFIRNKTNHVYSPIPRTSNH